MKGQFWDLFNQNLLNSNLVQITNSNCSFLPLIFMIKFFKEKLISKFSSWACKNRNVCPCKHYSKSLISHLQCRWMLDWWFFRTFLVSEIPILKGHNFRSLHEWIKMQNAIYKMSAVAPPLLIYILCHLYFACPPKPKQIRMGQRQF